MECDVDFQAATGCDVPTYGPRLRVELLTINLESPVTAESYEMAITGPPAQGDKNYWNMYNRLTDIWSTVISRYNTCNLTRREDRLPAISGLARRIRERTGLVYHCGLFFDKAEMVPRHLLWVPCHDPLLYRGSGPTWSWAAYQGAVEIWDGNADYWHDSGHYQQLRADFAVTVLELIEPHRGPDYNHRYGPAEDPTVLGAIMMEGKPKLVTQTHSRDFDRQNAYADAETIQIPLHGWPREFDCNERSYAILDDARASSPAPLAARRFKGWVCFDQDEEEDEPERFCVLPIIKTVRLVRSHQSTTNEMNTYTVWRVLAVERRSGRYGPTDLSFQRTGYGEVFGEHWFDNVRRTKFTLV